MLLNLADTSDNEDVARICLGTLSCEEDSEKLSESDTESFVDDVPPEPANCKVFPPTSGEEDSDRVEEDFDDDYISRRRRCTFIDDEAIESDHGGESCSGRKREKAVEESPFENHSLELEYILEGNLVGTYSAPQYRTVEASDVKAEVLLAEIPSPQRIRFVNRIRTKPSDSKSLESSSPTIMLSPGLSLSPIPERSVSSLSQGVATKLPAGRASDKFPSSPGQASKHNFSPHKALSDYVSRNEMNSPLESPLKTSFIQRNSSLLAESEGIRQVSPQDSEGEHFDDDESSLWSTRETLCPNSQWDPLLGLSPVSFDNERICGDPQIVVTNSLNTERGFQAAKDSLFGSDSDVQTSAHSFMKEQGTQTTKTVKRGKILPPHSLDVPVDYPSDCSSGHRHDSYVLLQRAGIGQDEAEFKASEKWTARDMCKCDSKAQISLR